MDAYLKALSIKSNYHQVWNNLSNTYANQGQYEQAVDACRKALEIKPDMYQAWNNLGNIYSNQGQYKQAIDTYRKAIELQATDSNAVENLAETITKLLQTQTVTESELSELETWLQGRAGFEVISSYITTYRRVVFGKEEKALYELPKEQRIFFEREILKRSIE